MKLNTKSDYRRRRHYRIRNKIRGTALRPRMAVYRSCKHLYVQFIDDDAQATLASASTDAGELKGASNNSETAQKLGSLAAEAAKAKGIETVVFDRGGFAFAGKVKILADAAREAGLKF
ncbi:MAG: large subunit ribosomal protein L18 [Verrucomicrobiales bacterium]|jgi:large subunit ribosomal protein L18